jgi:hypothetical protein
LHFDPDAHHREYTGPWVTDKAHIPGFRVRVRFRVRIRFRFRFRIRVRAVYYNYTHSSCCETVHP